MTENTFDAYLYQLVENKQKFIAQIMTSKAPIRIADDIDETALSYSEIKALATGNPLIIEKCNLDMEVGKLNTLKANYLNEKFALENLVLREYPKTIQCLKEKVEGYEEDILLVEKHPKPAEGFVGILIRGTYYSDKESAGREILKECSKLINADEVPLGEYRGFFIALNYNKMFNEYHMSLKGALSHTVSLGTDIYGNITRMDNLLGSFETKLEETKAEIANIKVQLVNAKKELEKPFAKEVELIEKSKRLKEVNILLNMDEKEKVFLEPEEENVEMEVSDRGISR